MKKILFVAAALAVAACTPQPTMQTGPDAEMTYDGLVRIDHSRFSNAWIDPNIDLSAYNKMILGPADFQFRTVPEGPRSSSIRRGNETEFWISPENRQRLIDEVGAVFREELANLQSFEIVEMDQRGPETLIAVAALHDIVSRVPPQMVGRGEVFLSSVGEATLIIELRDSLSGAAIYRAVDRRRADTAGGTTMTRSTQVTTWAEVRRWARRWATRLRDGLDSVHEG
ncbi:MAG: DUF3313 family protein [Woeseiaceae bacterium]|nr:DUF3313 family protein [Woeseiaceae bacterium]